MYIRSSEYLSTHTGKQIDDAIDTIRDYDAELAKKVDKTTKINGHELTEDINITAEEIGAMPLDTQYGASLDLTDGYLSLVDKGGAVFGNNPFIYPSWGEIQGDDLSENTVLQSALDSKQNLITSENMLSSDLVDDSGNNHKFASAEQLTQIASNTSAIEVINSKIPSQATSENKLTDKNFVNSSIATNTAYFIGTFQSVEDLEDYSGTLTNNDYAFVAH